MEREPKISVVEACRTQRRRSQTADRVASYTSAGCPANSRKRQKQREEKKGLIRGGGG